MTSTCSQVLVIVLFRHEAGGSKVGRAHRPVSGNCIRAFHSSRGHGGETGEGGLEPAGCAGGGPEEPAAAGCVQEVPFLPHPRLPGGRGAPAHPLCGHLPVPPSLREGEWHLSLWGGDEVHPPPAAGDPGTAEGFGGPLLSVQREELEEASPACRCPGRGPGGSLYEPFPPPPQHRGAGSPHPVGGGIPALLRTEAPRRREPGGKSQPPPLLPLRQLPFGLRKGGGADHSGWKDLPHLSGGKDHPETLCVLWGD